MVQNSIKECRDKYAVDRGHGVARALQTVLLNSQQDDKAQEMSLVYLPQAQLTTLGFITSR